MSQPSRAVAILASQAKPGASAIVWSDYAAALLVSSAAADDPLQSIDALWACDQALKIEADLPEALFNRALALRNLGLLSESGEALRKFLSFDKSPWAEEASRRLKALGSIDNGATCTAALKSFATSRPSDDLLRQSVRQCPQLARAYAETVWPADWADAVTSGNPKRATEMIDLAQRVAHELRAASGESLAEDALAVIERASGNQRAELAEAYLAYRGGRILHSTHDPTAAEQSLRHAAQLFRTAGSPMEYVARYYVGSALFEQFRLDAVAKQLDPLSAMHLEQRGYRALDGEIGWERGAGAAMRGALSDAFEIYAHSRTMIASLGESDLLATFDGLIAGAHEFAGEPLAAWRARRRALEGHSRSGNAFRVLTTLENAASACALRHEWQRALALLYVTARAANAGRNELVAAHSYAQQAIAHSQLGQGAAAREDLSHMRRWIALIHDQRQRDRAEADASFSEALFLAESDPPAALAHIESAQRFSEAANDRLQIPREQLQNARIRTRMNDRGGARRELAFGLAEIERQRAAIRNLEQRADMLSTANETFEAAITLALQDGDDAGAFALAERQRSRTLLDTFAAGGRTGAVTDRTPLSIDEIRSSLAPDAAIVEYVVEPMALIAFVIRPDGLTQTTTTIGSAEVSSLVASFRRAVSALRADDAVQVARSLAHVLVRPIRNQLAGARQIAFIPDGSLTGLSFNMLPEGASLLVDNAVILQAPSATLAIECSRRAQQRSGTSLLAVAGSVIDRKRYGALPLLTAVESEVRHAVRGHEGGRSVTLLGPLATPETVLDQLPRFHIVHIAAHAVSSPQSPLDSRFLLAPSATNSHGELRAAEIAATAFPKTRLVILAGCGTATSTEQRDGVVNLATAFLEAGIPTVVATMWSAEDNATSAFMIRFHRRLGHDDTGKAMCETVRDVRRTQLGAYPVQLGGPAVIGGISAFVRSRH